MINKICTDLETSKRLKELGIEGEACFYWRNMFSERNGYKEPRLQMLKNGDIIVNDLFISAYTLEQILEMLPEYIMRKDKRTNSREIVLTLMLGKKSVWYENFMIEDSEEINIEEDCSNLATAAAKLLIKLKEDKII